MLEKVFSRARDEDGFNLIELMVYILILAVMLGTATYFFISVRDVNSLNAAAIEVRSALERGFNMANAQNQRVTLSFYGPGSNYPNTYAFKKNDGSSEPPPLGSAYFTEQAGGNTVYYIKLQQGDSGLAIAASVDVVYDNQGTLMTVSPASVTVSRAGRSKTLSINANGEIN